MEATTRGPGVVMVLCCECEGTGYLGATFVGSADYECSLCHVCFGAGRVAGQCDTCGAPAAHADAGLPWCETCFWRCLVCDLGTEANDRLPFSGGGVVHTLCSLGLTLRAPRAFVEGVTKTADNTDAASHTHTRTGVGDSRSRGAMPKPTQRLLDTMRADGFIPMSEAVDLTGHAPSTMYDWIAAGSLEARRSGSYHFVQIDSLVARCPQIVAKLAAHGKGAA